MGNSMNNKQIERVPVRIFKSRDEGSKYVAREIASLIRSRNASNQKTVLGLATGSSPLDVYRELIRFHKEEGLSFKNVITFNLDEYYPMKPDGEQSYRRFMYEHLFNHIDIDSENVNIPDGTLAPDDIDIFCADYDSAIEALGGIDIQILGIGRSGHIGFNEPGSTIATETRLVNLDEVTIEDAAKDFGHRDNVPFRAITMGVKSIIKSKKVFLMAWGEPKADVVRKAVEEGVTDELPASYLQHHEDVLFLLDKGSASKLSRFEYPWLTGICDWNPYMQKKAVIWLARKTKKPVLKLTEEDYKAGGLTSLVRLYGSAYDLNLSIYNQLQRTITGWPGGKPGADDKTRPERSNPFPKRSIVFSPHPDDDVISMGGTFLRLVEQGHEVHVAYQTSGNIAVFDDDAHRFSDFLLGFSKRFGVAEKEIEGLYHQVTGLLKDTRQKGGEHEMVLAIKGLIRQGEAISACRFCGVEESNIHFLNLPFYETGSVKKNPVSQADIDIIKQLLQEVRPHQIYAAGDLHDPHGTHAVCLNAIFEAIEQLKDESWINDCYVWLYRGAWHEWDIEDIEMAVPLSPEELMKKRKAIFKHQSQKDSPVFPGKDKREFWQRAEDRNRATARLYDELGFTEYEAIEAFKRYHF